MSLSPTVAIVPAKIGVEGYDSSDMIYSEEGPKSPNYFFEKLVNEYPSDLERIRLSEQTVEEVTTVINKERDRLLNKLKELPAQSTQ